jgi:hypothetical protein
VHVALLPSHMDYACRRRGYQMVFIGWFRSRPHELWGDL